MLMLGSIPKDSDAIGIECDLGVYIFRTSQYAAESEIHYCKLMVLNSGWTLQSTEVFKYNNNKKDGCVPSFVRGGHREKLTCEVDWGNSELLTHSRSLEYTAPCSHHESHF